MYKTCPQCVPRPNVIDFFVPKTILQCFSCMGLMNHFVHVTYTIHILVVSSIEWMLKIMEVLYESIRVPKKIYVFIFDYFLRHVCMTTNLSYLTLAIKTYLRISSNVHSI